MVLLFKIAYRKDQADEATLKAGIAGEPFYNMC